jgi:hypothetical protein
MRRCRCRFVASAAEAFVEVWWWYTQRKGVPARARLDHHQRYRAHGSLPCASRLAAENIPMWHQLYLIALILWLTVSNIVTEVGNVFHRKELPN